MVEDPGEPELIRPYVIANAEPPPRPAPPAPPPSPSPTPSRTALAAPTASPTPPPVPGPIVGVAGKCVDNNGAITGNGNRIQLFECNGTVAQIWIFEPDGTLRVQGKCLRA